MKWSERSRKIFAQEIGELEKVASRIGDEMDEAVELIFHSSNKVVITGIGKTGIIGRKLAASLASTGTHAIFLNAAEAVHGDLGMVCRNDIVIILSNSGTSSEILAILEPLKILECTIIAMTGNPQSELARKADLVLDTGVTAEAGKIGLAPTTSTTAALVMGDALTLCLMEKRNFQAENFVLYHPGGALGKRLLTRVRHRMETNIPRVFLDSDFREVVYEVSSKRLGMTIVFDENEQPAGIITDGDIRRAIQNFDDIRLVKAKDFMTKNFKRIGPDVMVSDALELMDINKITTLAVVENEHLLGILSIHHIFDFRNSQL
ncbi:MAG: KpsF/GutQ family sugar-phosphate isomerase [Thermoguttaceae bacterium]|nr:KpsF/GutQ family sugar-phosphate isomerase [Thermoguttaceae bacterium]